MQRMKRRNFGKQETALAAAKPKKPARRNVCDDDVGDESATSSLKRNTKVGRVEHTDVLDDEDATSFVENIQTWYDITKRPLPWRGSDPYGVWVSEIMCQQTKVDTVIPYYKKWMEEFPNAEALAKASIDDVNRVWAGLGYYRRAKFLHEGAIDVVEMFNGSLPGTKKDLLAIKGIGDYTSSAIASICFGERVPAVDGNVMRVFARQKAVSLGSKDKILQKRATNFAGSIVKHSSRPGDLNQAIMELGAMICTPRKPKCSQCPVRSMCAAFDTENGNIEDIANKYPSRPAPKAANPERHVFVAVITGENRSVLATRRPNDGALLSNQWELVCIEKSHAVDVSVADLKTRLESIGACVACLDQVHEKSAGQYKHIFSHLTHHVTPFLYDLSNCKSKCLTSRANSDKLKWIPMKDLKRAGLTRSMTKALEICGLLLK